MMGIKHVVILAVGPAAGDLTSDKDLKAEGRVDEAAGKVQEGSEAVVDARSVVLRE